MDACEGFLTPGLLKGRVISADALYTQKVFCQEVIASGGEYLLVVKRNQPGFSEDLRLFFQNLPLDCTDWRTDGLADKGHGRQTHRLIQVSTELNEYLARDWREVGRSFVCVVGCHIP